MRALLIPLLLLIACGATGALEIHVSATGSDDQPGTAAAPVKTLEAARVLARPHAGKEPVTILVGDGVHYLDRTLVLNAGDSGSREAPVVYRAEHEGGAVISGGVPLDLRWAPYRDGIVKAPVPADLEIDQLFVDGERQPMARYPNHDPAKTDVPYRGAAADAISPGRAARWSDPAGGYIHALHAARWGGYHFLIITAA